MLNVTAAELALVKTAPVLKPVTRVELVSRSNPADVRAVIDTGDRNYDPERAGIVDGSVSADVNRGALRNLSLSIFDRSGLWHPGPNNRLWLDAQIRVYRGYAGTQLWPRGVFEITDPEVNDRHEVRISGTDKTSRANGQDQGGFTTVVKLPKGLNLKTALETLAAYPTWGETMLNLSQTDKGLPFERECLLTDYPWQKAQEIANLPGNFRPLHYDEAGRLTWFVDPDPNLLSPVWEIWPGGSRPGTALDGEFSKYISASKTIDAHGLRNWIGVRGGGGKSMPVFAYAADEDSNSLTSVQRIGHRISWWNGGRPDTLITTQAEAQARADYELRRLKQWHERIPLRIVELPFLQPWDVLRITNPGAGLNDNYQVVSFAQPLGKSVDMQVQGWRTREGA